MKKKFLLLFITLSVGVWLAISGGPCWGQETPLAGSNSELALNPGETSTEWESVFKVTKTFAASRDNTLFETALVGADLSDGRGSWLFTGRTGQPPEDGPLRRGLILFDLAAGGIPPNALVTKVTLQLHVSLSAPGSGTQTISLHRLLADWGEGISSSQGTGGIATPGDATWRHTFFDTRFLDYAGRGFLPCRQRQYLDWRYRLLYLVIHPDGVGRSRMATRAGNQLWLDNTGKRNPVPDRQTN